MPKITFNGTEIPGQAQEQQRIMRDLHQSLKQATDEQDQAKTFYITELINNEDKDYE